jgi:AcrR family transcriptional regulator
MARPRSALAHRKVLEAAILLFSEHGIDATSIDAIAEASGVSKATIYKHWQGKDSLLLEVMGDLHGLNEEFPLFNSGDLRNDLIAQLKFQPALDRQALRDKITPHLMAYAARNRALGAVWRARVIEPRRKALLLLMQRGEDRGELLHADPEIGIALLFGPIMYRHIFLARSGAKGPGNLEAWVADAFLALFSTGKRPAKSRLHIQKGTDKIRSAKADH